jgi:hypothetical protein
MLLLFETAAGFALFKVNREDKLEKVDDLYREFESLDAAQKVRFALSTATRHHRRPSSVWCLISRRLTPLHTERNM